jgi:hypothetical protein
MPSSIAPKLHHVTQRGYIGRNERAVTQARFHHHHHHHHGSFLPREGLEPLPIAGPPHCNTTE